jgi:hypothetical protein
MGVSEKTIIDFVKEELERLRQERLERLGGDLLRIEEGNIYVLELGVNTEFRRINTRFGERVVIPVTYNNEPRVLMVNPNGRLYRLIIEGINDAVKKVRDVSKITKFAITISRIDRYHYRVSVTPVL